MRAGAVRHHRISALGVRCVGGSPVGSAEGTLGGIVGIRCGGLIVSASFALFEPAFDHGGRWRAGVAFSCGAAAFFAADPYLDRKTARSSAGLDLLAVTFARSLGSGRSSAQRWFIEVSGRLTVGIPEHRDALSLNSIAI